MGIFTRLKTGWTLAMDSLRVLREEPSLAAFPVIGGLAGTVFLVLVLGGTAVFAGFESNALTYGALFVVYLGLTFVAAFANAALVYNAREVFAGRDPTITDGLAAAWRHKTPLFAWAIISAIVGVILRAVEHEDNLVAQVAAFMFSVAWSILTYFIIPVIVFEDVGVFEMFSRSGETFKETWGETAGAEFGLGLVTIGVTLVGLLLAGGVFLAFGGTGAGAAVAIALAVVVVLVVFVFGSALAAIAKTALYVYATEGKTPSQFENVDFRGAR
jgi:hypothetical protein